MYGVCELLINFIPDATPTVLQIRYAFYIQVYFTYNENEIEKLTSKTVYAYDLETGN